MELPMTNRDLLKLKAEMLTEAEVSEVLEYVCILESMSEQANTSVKFDKAMLKLVFVIMKDTPSRSKTLRRQQNALRN